MAIELRLVFFMILCLAAIVLLTALGGCTFIEGQTPDGTKFRYGRSLLDTKTKSAEVIVEKPELRVTVRLEGYSSTVSTEAFEALGKGLGEGMGKAVKP